MIIDAPALLAIVPLEADDAQHARAIGEAERPRPPSVTWFETTMRVDATGDGFVTRRMDAIFRDLRIELVPFTTDHAREARRARSLFGKSHPAQLNFGDSPVYGVAKHEREPLLFKGDDFAHTDIEPALRN